MILFLDDDPRRTKTFQSHVPQAMCAATAMDMINLLSSYGEVAIAFLDHDLGGEQFVDSNRPDCGMEVVRWVVANRPNVKQFIIHSLNTPAAQSMEISLIEAGYEAIRIPFIRMPWEQVAAAARNIFME